MAASSSANRQERVEHIRRAAVAVFAAKGYRRTSMADLAAAAGLSRPAVYQYFDNRADVFRAAFDALLQDATDAALAALEGDAPIRERIDGYLQRVSGDGYEVLSSTPHGDELMEARHEFAADVAEHANRRAVAGLRRTVADAAPTGAAERVDAIVELVTLAPAGLKADRPSSDVYRSRLTTLADAASALLAP